MFKYLVLFLSVFCISGNVYANDNDLVISSALKKYCTDSKKTILQNNSVTIEKENLKSTSATLNAEALIDLSVQNVSSKKINFNCSQLIVLDEAEIDLAFKNKPKNKYPRYLNERWGGFFEKYSGSSGIVKISLPGYSNDRKYAIIFIASSCGPLCGQSNLIQLKNIEGAWVFEKSEELTHS
jgi:hypothetical protein